MINHILRTTQNFQVIYRLTLFPVKKGNARIAVLDWHIWQDPIPPKSQMVQRKEQEVLLWQTEVKPASQD